MPITNAAAPVGECAGDDSSPERIIVENRFGCYEFSDANSVHFPNGLLGFADCCKFGVANLPDPKLEQFKLLQSLEKADLCFIVTALPDNGPFQEDDLDELCRTASIPRENAVFLLIVTIRQQGDGISMSVNERAPIVMDPHAQRARQCVLSNSEYQIQKPFYGWDPAA